MAQKQTSLFSQRDNWRNSLGAYIYFTIFLFLIFTSLQLCTGPEGVSVLSIKERDKKDKDAKEKKKKSKKTASTTSAASSAGAAAAAVAEAATTQSSSSKSSTTSSGVKKKSSTKHATRSAAPSAEHDDAAADSAPLQAGWVAILDAASGKHYYHNATLNETTWDRPSLPELSDAVPPLPPTPSGSSSARKRVDESTDAADNDDNDAAPAADADDNNNNNDDDASGDGSGGAAANDELPVPAAKPLTLDAVVSALETNGFVDESDGVERAYTKRSAAKSTRPALPEGQREAALPVSIADQINSFQLENFAKKYFDQHKKGVFRRQIPIKRMLRWDNDPIPNAMIKTNKASHSKEAVAQFKNILRYMGDAPASTTAKVARSQMYYAQQLIEKAVNMPELRDEIYVQLCKQTNDNPNPQSLTKGWELFVMCAYSFPPTKDFEDWLRQYIEANQKQQGTVPLYASYTLRLLNRTVRLFATMRSKMPSEKELQVQREAPFNPSPFGATLLECMDLQANKAPDAKLPYMLTLLAEGVLNGGGPNTEGIFRVPADPTNALKLKVSLEGGSYDLVCKDVHAVGSVLKLWLRELAEPLVPDELYDECVKIADNAGKCVKVAQTRLPPLERACLLYLCNFLRTMAQHSEKTKMNDANLAMVFAPNVLRCPSVNPQTIYENTKHEVSFLLALIRNFKE